MPTFPVADRDSRGQAAGRLTGCCGQRRALIAAVDPRLPPSRRPGARLTQLVHAARRVPRAHGPPRRRLLADRPARISSQAAASGRIPERAVAVTLDDGYLDALTIASPILTELGVPATFFVNTDRLRRGARALVGHRSSACSCRTELPGRLTLAGSENGSDLRMPTATTEQRQPPLERMNRAAWPLDAAAPGSRCRVLRWSGVRAACRERPIAC